MELENFAEDDWANTPPFDLKSDDAVLAQTWGPGLKPLSGGQSATVAVSSTTTSSKAVETTRVSSSVASSTTSSALTPSLMARPSTTMSPAIPSEPSPPPSTSLSSAAKAGISIGSIFCALALIIAVLLFLNARRSRRMTGQGTKPAVFSLFRSPKQPSHEDAAPDKVANIHEGPYEVNGLGRPNELQGMPRSELHWMPMGVELGATSPR